MSRLRQAKSSVVQPDIPPLPHDSLPQPNGAATFRAQAARAAGILVEPGGSAENDAAAGMSKQNKNSDAKTSSQQQQQLQHQQQQHPA